MTANDRDEEGKEVARLNSQLAGGMGQKVSLLCRARYSRSRCFSVRPAVLGLGMDLACLMQMVFAPYIG